MCRQRKAYPKPRPKMPKTATTDMSPGSVTRRIANLVYGDDGGTSTSTISAKRLLVLSQDKGDEVASKEPTK